MNEIRNIYKPEKNQVPSSPPKCLLMKLATQLGVTLTESDWNDFEVEAKDMWNKLNYLHASDPKAYTEYIQRQAEEANKISQDHDKGQGERYFTPNKGFAIEVSNGVTIYSNLIHDTSLKNQSTSVLLVNVCQHQAVYKPTDCKTKKPVEDHAIHPPSDIEVPLLVSSKLRQFDYKHNQRVAIDVVFHPWCIEQALKSHIFRDQIIKLALEWINNEHSSIEIKMSDCLWSVIIGDTYIGGESVNQFQITSAMLKKKQNGNVPNHDETNLLTSKGLIAYINEAFDTKSSDKALTFPGSAQSKSDSFLIEEMGSEPNQSSGDLDEKQKVLIKEMGLEPNQSSGDLDENQKIDTVVIKEQLKAGSNHDNHMLKKGFLKNLGTKRYQSLYDIKGSSGAGSGTGGGFVKLLDRAHVVDKSSTERTDESNEVSLAEQDLEGTFEYEFKRMCDLADPEFADTTATIPSDDEETLSKLASLSSIVSSNEMEILNHQTTNTSSNSVAFTKEQKADTIKIVFDLKQLQTIQSMSDVELSLKDYNEIAIKTNCGKSSTIKLEQNVHPGDISAQFFRYKKMLIVSVKGIS